ncbi:MAG: AmmeMemoRadiSam system protein B [Patescibacteria group bacterium]|nr:AmmeMemoRadiSam system protein B [Patescibacteria group bacterium]
MSIVFAAIAPHPPILIPGVGKENIKQLQATSNAYLKLEQELYASQAETIIIISPHGPLQETNFTLCLSQKFKGDFADFGDLATRFTLNGNIGLAHKIREKLEAQAPLALIGEDKLDHGSAIPLYLLTRHLPKIKIIPLYYSGLDLTAHYAFGQIIKNELLSSKTRIAVIASGDLSHRLTKNAPAGYNPKGKKFDKKLIDYLTNKKTDEIIKLSHSFVADAGECGLKSIIIILGILEGIKCEPEFLSYEAPFGVGYLVMNFKL